MHSFPEKAHELKAFVAELTRRVSTAADAVTGAKLSAFDFDDFVTYQLTDAPTIQLIRKSITALKAGAASHVERV